jgi:hypothetical protein
VKKSFIIAAIILFCTPLVATENIKMDDNKKEFETIDPVYQKTDVNALIKIDSAGDIATKRTTLVELIWGRNKLPQNDHPDHIENALRDQRYDDIDALKQIDKLVFRMEHGLHSVSYHFHPVNGNNKLLIYHQGHNGDFILGKSFISRLLANGYSVAAFCMPLKGLNNQPTIELQRFGFLKITTHDHMKFLNPKAGHPLQYFLEPVIRMVNYAKTTLTYSHIDMAGISGGGWTTTLIAALDPGIEMSFPVAGSYPLYLRSQSRRDWGDWEQTLPEILSLCNYPELYIMGASGKGRLQLQIINQYDECCFAGLKWKTYADIVKTKVAKTGSGEWDLFLDDSHNGHMISPVAQNVILQRIKRK